MRRSYRSYVMNLAAKSSMRKDATTSDVYHESVETKKALKKHEPIVISHYDNNQPISLSLPESLCSDHASNDQDNRSQENKETLTTGQSKRYDDIDDAVIISESQSVTDYSEPYSDANHYFKTEHDEVEKNDDRANTFLTSKSLETNPQEEENTSQNTEQNSTQDLQDMESQVEDMQNPVESNREADEKFEEDLRAILDQKNAIDRQREQENPAEAIKNKDNGVANASDQEFKKKLKDRHAIFDQIAQSMKMADTYDFGAIAMNKKLDDLEEVTNEDFTQKIQELLVDDEEKESEGPSYASDKKDDDKVLTEDFLDDINRLNEISSEQSKMKQDFAEDAIILEDSTEAEKEKNIEDESNDSETVPKFSKQSTFNSTISIKHRYLKSRVFSATGGSVSLTIDSHWFPQGCSDLTHLNVTLTQEVNLGIDDEKGTKRFSIGTSDTQVWSNLPPGNYYLTFYFVNNTNPHCELKGTINVIT